jgi:hypothetical protein
LTTLCGNLRAARSDRAAARNLRRRHGYAIRNQRPTRDSMSLEEATVSKVGERAGRGAGSSGLSGLFGSRNERGKTDPRTRSTASESSSPHTRLPHHPWSDGYAYNFTLDCPIPVW